MPAHGLPYEFLQPWRLWVNETPQNYLVCWALHIWSQTQQNIVRNHELIMDVTISPALPLRLAALDEAPLEAFHCKCFLRRIPPRKWPSLIQMPDSGSMAGVRFTMDHGEDQTILPSGVFTHGDVSASMIFPTPQWLWGFRSRLCLIGSVERTFSWRIWAFHAIFDQQRVWCGLTIDPLIFGRKKVKKKINHLETALLSTIPHSPSHHHPAHLIWASSRLAKLSPWNFHTLEISPPPSSPHPGKKKKTWFRVTTLQLVLLCVLIMEVPGRPCLPSLIRPTRMVPSHVFPHPAERAGGRWELDLRTCNSLGKTSGKIKCGWKIRPKIEILILVGETSIHAGFSWIFQIVTFDSRNVCGSSPESTKM